MFKAGDLVKSLCGHDKGEYFIVLEAENGMVMICDGKRRKAHNKKMKKNKHVEATGFHSDLINNLPLFAVDANVRREIKRLTNLIAEV